jgi:hypothetical protein
LGNISILNLGLLKGVQQSWDRWKGADLESVVSNDVDQLVTYMAWVRNHIRASNVTDYNDAQMASQGAKEVKEMLKQVLRLQEQHYQEINDDDI